MNGIANIIGYVSRKAGIFAIIFLALTLTLPGAATPDFMDDIMRISLKFFPKFLAVDLDLKDKVQKKETLNIVAFYKSDKSYAERVAEKMGEKNPSIGGFHTEITTASSLPDISPSAVIVVEKLDEASLRKVVEYCRNKGILLFSPFEEDVIRGATVSIKIGARIQPYFNDKALAESKIRIHPIVIKSSVIYGGGAQ